MKALTHSVCWILNFLRLSARPGLEDQAELARGFANSGTASADKPPDALRRKRVIVHNFSGVLPNKPPLIDTSKPHASHAGTVSALFPGALS